MTSSIRVSTIGSVLLGLVTSMAAPTKTLTRSVSCFGAQAVSGEMARTILPEAVEDLRPDLAGVISAGVDKTECYVPLAKGAIVFPDFEVTPAGIDYVRLIDSEGKQVAYWDSFEWEEAGQETMAAILQGIKQLA